MDVWGAYLRMCSEKRPRAMSTATRLAMPVLGIILPLGPFWRYLQCLGHSGLLTISRVAEVSSVAAFHAFLIAAFSIAIHHWQKVITELSARKPYRNFEDRVGKLTSSTIC